MQYEKFFCFCKDIKEVIEVTYPPVEMFSSLLPLLCVFSHVLSAPAVNIRIGKKRKNDIFFPGWPWILQDDPSVWSRICSYESSQVGKGGGKKKIIWWKICTKKKSRISIILNYNSFDFWHHPKVTFLGL